MGPTPDDTGPDGTGPATDPSVERIFARPATPRSIRVHEAAVAATRELLHEGGIAAATTDAISARSGVSKATLYKHWPSRTAVAAEAFGRDVADAVRLPDTGSTRDDLAGTVLAVSRFAGRPEGILFAELLAACVTDEGGAAYFRAWFLAAFRREVRAVWARGVERGDVRPEVDVDTATDLLLGPLVFRLLTGHLPLTDSGALALADAALDGLLEPATTTHEKETR